MFHHQHGHSLMALSIPPPPLFSPPSPFNLPILLCVAFHSFVIGVALM